MKKKPHKSSPRRERIRLLLTSSKTLINLGRVESLKNNSKYDFYIVGVDANADGFKLPLIDEQIRVPHGKDKSYLKAITKIVKEKQIDVIVPASDYEVYVLSKYKGMFDEIGVAVVCSSFEAVAKSVNKAAMLDFLKEKHVATPNYAVPTSTNNFIESAKKLGYPKRMLIAKPVVFEGGNRGVWYLKENFSDELLRVRNICYVTLEGFVKQLKHIKPFPSLVLMEYLTGEEYSVDGLAENGNPIYILPRVRVSPLPGLSQEALIKKNDEVYDYVARICRTFGFNSIFNVQLKYDENNQPKVYEINPRPSATAVANEAAGVDLVLFSILQALHKPYPKNLRFHRVRMIRYWREFYTNK